MFDRSTSLWLGITFVAIGAINVWLILQASARVRDAKAGSRLIAAHRLGGYLFIALFCVMGYYMFARLDDAGGASAGSMIHLTLAIVLSPLLFVKVLIARYYKSHHSVLMPLGLTIFVLAFVLIGITAGPSLAHRAKMETVSLASIDLPPTAIDVNIAASTMEKRCSKCHTLDRVAGAHKDARGWLATVNRMQALPHSGISEEDSRIIVSYLASQSAPKGSATEETLSVARAIVDQRCGRCHSLDRVYQATETAGEWKSTVARMAAYAEGSRNALQPGEAEQIVNYLSTTQSPGARNARKAEAAIAPSATHTIPDRLNPPSPYDTRAIGFVSIVVLSMLTLVVRRPSRVRVVAGTEPVRVGGGPLILKLANIRQEVSDARTLRFIVPDGRKLNARPGQFLTFSFLFDGKKTIRSYSISSSAARSGYVEITTKRVPEGCVSVFLNDRAPVGMTVEATGPFGQFCFDESRHASVVLLAAGSGITPMMAMLRYMDDLCLETVATLLYCVRTSNDVIFRDELEQLQSSLKNFDYHVLPSQTHGRVSREYIERHINDIPSRIFFLCGPPSFMEASRAILIDLGVKPESILQESFGFVPKNPQAPTTPPIASATVNFTRSGKTCTVRNGQTLLEAAEEHGVAIPFSCRQGQCGTCKTKLLEGNVQMDAQDGLDPESKAQGFVLTCVGHADGDVKLDI